MNDIISHRLSLWIKVHSRIAGAIAIVAGSIVIIGWILDIELLKSLHPSLVSMKANTALAFVLAGISLLFHASSGAGWQRMIGRLLASLVVVIGLLTVAEYLFTWDAGIDQLLFHEAEGTIGTFLPGRMALSGAINFCLLGISLLMLELRTPRGDWLAQLFALVVGLFGILGLVAYVYGLSGSSGYAVYARMALHTACAFIVLSVGVVGLRPDSGILAVILGTGTGGFMARRLMFAAVVIPVILGWLTTRGETWGWYGNQFGDVINTTAYIGILLVLIWIIARSLHRIDAERVRAEKQLQDSETQFKDLFDDAPVGYHELDAEGRISRINQTELRSLGYRAEEMLGHVVWEFVTEREVSRSAVMAKLSGAEPPAQGVERNFIRKDGTTITVMLQDRLLLDAHGEISGIRSTLQDVSELKKARELLRKSEEEHRTVLKNLAEGVGIVDAAERFRFANPAAEAIFGVPAGNLVGRSLQEFMDPEGFQKMIEQTTNRRKGEATSYELQIARPDGAERDLLVTVSPLIENDGDFVGSIGVFRDLTERKRAEEALAWEEYLLNSLLQNVPDHIYFKDLESRFMRVSRDQARIFGLTDPGQAVGKTDFDFFTEEHARRAFADEQEILRTGQTLTKEENETWPDRHDSWVLTTKMPLRDKQGRIIGTFGISRDITERKKTEQERESLISELKKALDQVKTLGGLVPICASCKKIRDDKGYWNQLEKYLGDHTDAKLTHGLCPDCAKVYFPEAAAKKGL